jgi:hypothetical protein
MKYYSTKEFLKEIKISKSTLNRRLNNNPRLKQKYISKEKGKNVISSSLIKYFNPAEMENAYHKAMKQNRSLKKMLRKIHSPMNKREEYGKLYWQTSWSLMGTVSFLNANEKRAMGLMCNYANHLRDIANEHEDLKIDILFSVEPFSENGRDALFHSHFVLYMSNQEMRKFIMNDFNTWFKKVKIKEIKKYYYWKPYVFYMFKEDETLSSVEPRWNFYSTASNNAQSA